MVRQLRKLLKGETRVKYSSGRTAIVRYKTQAFRKNRKFDRKSRSWISKPKRIRQTTIREIGKKEFFKSQLEFKFRGKNKSNQEYEWMKIRVWINDIKTYNEQELRIALRDVLEAVGQDFSNKVGSGIAKKTVFYDTMGIEREEIALSEADNLGLFQYYVDIKGWIKDGII
tara:strand:- start:202 stop:714 length:513 start_codon:yes stop_codon:yes gene_type:complete